MDWKRLIKNIVFGVFAIFAIPLLVAFIVLLLLFIFWAVDTHPFIFGYSFIGLMVIIGIGMGIDEYNRGF